MNSMKLKAYAKINLGLDVLRKREDGYHEVRMVMQMVKHLLPVLSLFSSIPLMIILNETYGSFQIKQML